MIKRKQQNLLFTQGPILVPLLRFALPVLFALLLQSMSAFVAQNFGAGKLDRARRGMVYGMAVSFCFGLILAYVSFFHGSLLTGIFAKDREIILAGADYLRAYAIDTLLVSFLFCFTGYFNGCGKTAFVMLQGIMGAFCVRIPVSYLMSRIPGAFLFQVGLAIPMSTVVQILMCLLYFARTEKARREGRR